MVKQSKKKKTKAKKKTQRVTEDACFIPRAIAFLEIHEAHYARIANDMSAELRLKWSKVFLWLAFAIYDHSEELWDNALMELLSIKDETEQYIENMK